MISEKTLEMLTFLVDFLSRLVVMYVPCLIGCALSTYIRSKRDFKKSTKKKKTTAKPRQIIVNILMGAILPSVIMVLLSDWLPDSFQSGVILMAIATLLGAMGDDVHKILTPTGILTMIKLFSANLSSIKDIENSIETIEDLTNDNKDKEQ